MTWKSQNVWNLDFLKIENQAEMLRWFLKMAMSRHNAQKRRHANKKVQNKFEIKYHVELTLCSFCISR